MKITTLRKMRYEGTFIYVMNFEYVFQYLFSWSGEIYQGNITFKPKLIDRLKYRLGMTKVIYTADQLEEAEKAVISGAMASIDKIVEIGGKTRQFAKHKEKDIEMISADVLKRSREKCVWRAIDTADDFYYECLTHFICVKMKDGQKPVHDVLSPMQVTTQING